MVPAGFSLVPCPKVFDYAQEGGSDVVGIIFNAYTTPYLMHIADQHSLSVGFLLSLLTPCFSARSLKYIQ
jgi:hypothetical protein